MPLRALRGASRCQSGCSRESTPHGARPRRQIELRAVQRLDRCPSVNIQNQRIARRIHVRFDEIRDFLHTEGVRRQLERRRQARLDAALAEPAAPSAPVRAALGPVLESAVDLARDPLVVVAARPSRAGPDAPAGLAVGESPPRWPGSTSPPATRCAAAWSLVTGPAVFRASPHPEAGERVGVLVAWLIPCHGSPPLYQR